MSQMPSCLAAAWSSSRSTSSAVSGSGTDWIAVDWGTSTLRVWAMRRDGSVVSQRASDDGMARLAGGDFEAAFRALAADMIADARAHPLVGAKPADIRPVERERAAGQRMGPRQHPHQRGLPRTIGTNQRDHLGLGHVERERMHRREQLVARFDRAQPQNSHSGELPR